MKHSRQIDHLPAAINLTKLHNKYANIEIKHLFIEDPERFANYSLEASGLFLDYSKHKINEKIMSALLSLAEQAGVEKAKQDMMSGDKINFTEKRSVLHVTLRKLSKNNINPGDEILSKIVAVRERMRDIAYAVNSGSWKGYSDKTIKHVVNIGIGGSYLGSKDVLSALEPYHSANLSYHFVSNIDPTDLTKVIAKVDLESTLFIVASKSFSTLETIENAKSARKLLVNHGCPESKIQNHFIAISTNLEATKAFGIAEENTLPMWDWVGGRYSLWSAIGLIIVIIIGYDNYLSLLKGAENMDEHFLNAPIEKNMPIIMAVLGVWYQNYFNSQTHALISYDSRLKDLSEHIQQVDMESNGKQVNQQGNKVDYDTGAIIWGGVGTNDQHSYMQLIHQGTRTVPIDFIIPVKSFNPLESQQQWLLANALAQSKALMEGKTEDIAYDELIDSGKQQQYAEYLAKHKVIAGNKPSSTILMKQLTPETMGALIALYEHKVFVQGLIWNINSFDQWGVELGKELSSPIMEQLTGTASLNLNADSSTAGLINMINSYLKN
jgi:glucose-6-phosphate isomerase